MAMAARHPAGCHVALHHKGAKKGVNSRYRVIPKQVPNRPLEAPVGFPVSIDGTISLKEYSTTPALVAAQIQEMLESAHASEISVRGTEVLFVKNLMQPMWSTTILLPFDSGQFAIEARDGGLVVHYRLSTRRNMRVVTAMLGIFGTIAAVSLGVSAVFGTWDGPQEIMDVALSIAPAMAGMWLWLVGMNYLIAKIRTPFWLRSELLR